MKVAIVVTAANEAQAESCQKELDGRKDLADFLCLAVADPAGCRIGSGGGTLNALVAAHDAIAGPHSQTCDWLDEHLVCVVHSGGDSQRSPSQSVCGKAWSTLPLFGGRSGGELAAPFDLLVDQLLALCAGCTGGCVVACSDVLLHLPTLVEGALAAGRGVTGLAVNADGARYGPKHGVYVAGGGDAAAVGGAACANFLQKASMGALEAAGAVDGRGEVALDSGVLYVDAPTSKALLKLCTDDGGALRSATSRGAAGGCARVELYSDVLNAVSGGGYDDFPTYAAMKADEADPAKVRRFREALWAALRPVELRVHRPPGARFAHLGTTAEYMDLLTLPSLFREPFGLRRFARNAAPPGCLVDDGADAWSVALNSVISKPSTLAAKAVVEHSRVDSLDGLGAGSLLSCCRGLPADFSLDAKTMLQQVQLLDGSFVALLFGVADDVKAPFEHATFLGRPWADALERWGAAAGDLWAGEPGSLWTAKLFAPAATGAAAARLSAGLQASSGDADARALWKRAPRLSMREVLARGDKVAELDWKLRLRREVSDRAGPFAAALSAARPADDATGLRVVDGRVSEPVESLEHLEVASGAWDVLAVTADTRRQADYYVRQLRCRPGLKCREIVGVCTSIDAAGSRLGSGGATLHALLTVAERLSAAAGDETCGADRLRGKKVLILHSGASGLNGGALWLPVPLDAGGGPAASVDVVLSAVNGAAATSGPGVWVCSGELLLSSATRAALASLDWTAGGRRGAVTALAVPGSGAVAAKHGCFTKIDPEATSGAAAAVRGFEYMPRGAPAGTLVACGIFRFETEAALAFLDAHAVPPFSSCTAPGVDDGLAPAPFSLFLDVIPALLGAAAPPAALALRGVLRKRCALYAVAAGPEKGDAPLFLKRPRDCLDFGSSMGSYVKEEEGSFTRKAVVLNSVLGGDGAVAERAVLVNCRFAAGSAWSVGAGCVAVGLRDADVLEALPAGVCAHRVPLLRRGAHVVVAHGVDDDVEGTRFRGADLETDVLPRLRNVAAEDLWRPGDVRCLATARLFAVGAPPPGWLLAAAAGEPAAAPDGWLRSDRVSLREAYDDCDVVSDGAWAAELEVRSRCDFVKRALEGRSPVGLRPTYDRLAALAAGDRAILDGVLDVLDGCARGAATDATRLDVAARALAHGADCLCAFAKRAGALELRSGAARNPHWARALGALDAGEGLVAALGALRDATASWIEAGGCLVRAARHHEAAAARLVSAAVGASLRSSGASTRGAPTFVAGAVEATAPLRVDLAGGWTDTPPVAFEHGGVVTNVAVRLDGRRPIGARATRLDAPVLRFRVETADGSVLETEAAALADLDDRSNPQAPAALLKCALVVCGVVDPRGAPLDVQLAAGGLEVASWSRVPTGSGLGTSSILAACLVAAIGGAADAAYDVDARRRDIVHDVMRVEQELTTGGGWQDNVGGVYGGAKIAVSPPRLPLTVDTTAVPMAPGLLDAHLVLAYTGRARLAKNLLQSVLRKWHARLPGITTTTDALVAGARRAAAALEAGDLARLGAALDAYWAQKKTMADGAEPAFIRDMIAALRPRVHGAALCGAGGGGFLCLITKQPNDVDAIRRVLEAHADLGDVSLHVATVDREGLTLARS